MGYTTRFTGRFNFDKLPPTEVIVKLNEIAEIDHRNNQSMPGYYCQWEPTKDCMGLEWDGNEKFYDYVEWLDYLIVNVLNPAGINLSGSVHFQGEEIGDSGILSIENNRAVIKKLSLVSDELSELQAFRDWVLKQPYATRIKAEWQQHKLNK